MPKKFKFAVLRARHDTSPTINDRACLEMLIASESRRSLLNYWTDNTDGYLDFVGSNMFQWVDVTFTAADLDANRTVPRATQAAKAYAATKAAFGEDSLKGFDGFIVITFPGAPGQMTNPMAGQPGQPAQIAFSFDAGTGGGVPDKAACVLPVMASDHTFMVHEVGHVLGFGHTYGVLNNGVEWDNQPPWDQGQVYGDPYDIMSSATFGTRNRDSTLTQYIGSPTFSGPAVPGWPNPNAVTMGPAPARAQVHLWDDQAIPATRTRHLQMPGGNIINARIYAAGAHVGSPELLVIHPQNEDSAGRGRCYLEYRAKGRWDEGLDLFGSDLARQAVVAHTLADAVGDGVRCWYRGRILVPLEADTDLDIAGTPLNVRAVYVAGDASYVDVEIRTSKPRGVDLTVTGSDDVIASSGTQQKMGTPCGDTITWGTWVTQSFFNYRPHTYGFGGTSAPDVISPLIAWTVGGVPVPAGSGTMNVPVDLATFSVEYVLHPATFELSLISRGGEKYAAPVVATATEPGGGNAMTANASFSPLGYFDGFAPGDLAKLDRCMEKYLESVQLRPRDLLIPPGPDPFREQWQDRVNQSRVLEFARQITRSHPGSAAALRAIAALRYAHIPVAPVRRSNRAAVWLALGAAALIGAIFGLSRRSAARF